MTVLRVFVIGALSVLCTGADAPATDPPPVATLACAAGDSWTYLYAAKSENGKALNGSETFTRTDCGDRRVNHPTGNLIKADVTADAEGNLYSGFSVFTGTPERYNKPFPYLRLPLAPGNSWEGAVDIDTGDGGRLTGTGHWRAIGWETITVPAGTYVCLRRELKLDFDYTSSDGGVSGNYRDTSWYCPEVRSDAKAISSDSFGDTSSRELTAVALK
jgi:hypothetical protein